MDQSTFSWLFWLGGFFLAYELAAVAFGWRTLSRQVWNWFSLGQRKIYWPVRRAVFVVFWIALGIHFYWQAPAFWSVILPGIPFAAVIVLSSFVWKDATVSDAAPAPVLEKGKIMKQRLVSSMLFGAAAVIAALQINIPNTKQGWLGLASVFVMAAYGKFSANDSLVGVNRKVWTDEERAANANGK